ncbi:MAG: lytic transglycosylase domain-containing protein [Acidobacteriota bacterium]
MIKVLNILLCLLGISIAVQAQSPSAIEQKDIGRNLDRFLERVTVAADAADIVKEADEHRQAAVAALKAGHRDEARAQFRLAGEVIAAAAPERDEKRDDPFLRDYLKEITSAIIALDENSKSPSVSANLDGKDIADSRVASHLKHFRGRGRVRLSTGLARLAEYRTMMARIFREEGVPEWLLAIGLVESGYNTEAISPKQALGIWQFIPGTGDRYGLKRTAFTDERKDPEKSTRAAARYLRDLYALFNDWPLAIAAYNAGEERIAKVMRYTGIRDFWTMAERQLLPAETINYVPAVLAASHLIGSYVEEAAQNNQEVFYSND